MGIFIHDTTYMITNLHGGVFTRLLVEFLIKQRQFYEKANAAYDEPMSINHVRMICLEY